MYCRDQVHSLSELHLYAEGMHIAHAGLLAVGGEQVDVEVELDVGDTVIFNSLAEAGVNHAIRITNYDFKGFAFEKLLHDAWTQYSPVENYYPYFIYGVAGGHDTSTQDNSIIPSSCNTHTFSYENNKAKSRIVTCLGNEEEVLMKLYGYDSGGATIVALRLTKTNT